MTSLPGPEPKSGTLILDLVRLGKPDLEEIIILEKLCYPQPWTEANFIGELQRPITLALGFKRGPEVAAHCIFWLITPEIHLLNLAVRPTYRRLGLARRLLKAMTTIGRRVQVDCIYLEVRPSNEPALTLYKSLNFKLAGRRPDYYDDGEEAILMTLNI